MKASVAIQVLPGKKETADIVAIVDQVIAYLKSSGLKVHVGPFETTIEGDDIDLLLDMVKECQKIVIQAGAPSVSSYVKIFYSPEGVLGIDEKIAKHQ